MKVTEILSPRRIRLDVAAGSKKRVLEAMSELLASGDSGLTATAVFERLHARERLGSTGLGHGVALPHGRMPALDHTVGALVRVSEPVDFDAPDQVPVDLLFGLLVPEESTAEHLELLAALASAFDRDDLRRALREAGSADEVEALLARHADSAAS